MGVHVTYVSSTGETRTVEADAGLSVMTAAVNNGVPEMESDCGGCCTCGGCHVYVDQDWAARFDPMSKLEEGLLSLSDVRRETSRLACQLILSPAADGAVVYTLKPEGGA